MAMAVAAINSFGELLRRWREARRMSQLELGLEAGVSARHISFIETGRARPSREMVIMLSGVLDVPLRERNVLLQAAGFAPVYRETSLDAPQMAQVRQALELILRQQEPFGALVFDRRWEVIMANAAYVRMACLLLGAGGAALAPYTVAAQPRLNLMKLLFDPNGWRPHIVNWEVVAASVVARLHREVLRDRDPATGKLLETILAYPGVPARWRKPDYDAPQDLVIPVEIRVADQTMRLFSTITALGSPQDITLQELHIEALHPADEATATLVRSLAAQPAGCD
ncbi:MAG TPA: helix-turn-helix transcriptional regulator [Blastocatellia bacterium]|nr:helix-turn-helix transcriptional regulator [Blastocatellia bacterium]